MEKLNLELFLPFALLNTHDITGGECNTCDQQNNDDISTGDPGSPDVSDCLDGTDKDTDVPTGALFGVVPPAFCRCEVCH